MHPSFAVMSLFLCTGMLVACDRPADKPMTDVPPVASQPAQAPQTAAASKASLPPIQGQVDSKEPAQRRDFETTKR